MDKPCAYCGFILYLGEQWRAFKDTNLARHALMTTGRSDWDKVRQSEVSGLEVTGSKVCGMIKPSHIVKISNWA